MIFTTIMEIQKHFQEAMIFENYFLMARRMCVQPPLLARLATVLVLLFSWRGISCPSSYFFMVRRMCVQPCFGTRSRR